MYRNKIIEPIGTGVAITTALFSFFLFYSETKEILGSMGAALMTTGLSWISYIILRWMLLAIRQR